MIAEQALGIKCDTRWIALHQDLPRRPAADLVEIVVLIAQQRRGT